MPLLLHRTYQKVPDRTADDIRREIFIKMPYGQERHLDNKEINKLSHKQKSFLLFWLEAIRRYFSRNGPDIGSLPSSLGDLQNQHSENSVISSAILDYDLQVVQRYNSLRLKYQNINEKKGKEMKESNSNDDQNAAAVAVRLFDKERSNNSFNLKADTSSQEEEFETNTRSKIPAIDLVSNYQDVTHLNLQIPDRSLNNLNLIDMSPMRRKKLSGSPTSKLPLTPVERRKKIILEDQSVSDMWNYSFNSDSSPSRTHSSHSQTSNKKSKTSTTNEDTHSGMTSAQRNKRFLQRAAPSTLLSPKFPPFNLEMTERKNFGRNESKAKRFESESEKNWSNFTDEEEAYMSDSTNEATQFIKPTEYSLKPETSPKFATLGKVTAVEGTTKHPKLELLDIVGKRNRKSAIEIGSAPSSPVSQHVYTNTTGGSTASHLSHNNTDSEQAPLEEVYFDLEDDSSMPHVRTHRKFPSDRVGFLKRKSSTLSGSSLSGWPFAKSRS